MIPRIICEYMTDAEIADDATEAKGSGHQLAMVSADRSDAEKHEAYTVEWREPANKQSFADHVRNWF